MSKGNLFDFFVRVAGSTTTEDERQHSLSAAAMEPLTLTSPPLHPTTSSYERTEMGALSMEPGLMRGKYWSWRSHGINCTPICCSKSMLGFHPKICSTSNKCRYLTQVFSERGFSAMGAAHSKLRSELSHAQVFAHLMIGFNGPSVHDFTAQLDIESRQPNWPLYIHPNNFN